MIGKTISHYQILEKLGEGGMGIVYKAEDTKLKRIVALKFLSQHALANEQEKARFVYEARAAAALDHPNICTIYEIDEKEGQIFIAMAFIDGKTLKEFIAQPLKVEGILDIAIQAADGLTEAHKKGVIHRDIKSTNIMITESGQAKIMDFGLAKLAKVGDLRIIARTSVVQYKNTEKRINEIAAELNVNSILEGTVRRVSNRVRITAQLIDAKTEEHLWAETYDREYADVFAIQSDVAQKIAQALKATLTPTEIRAIERKPTENVEAYDYYLKGN